MVLHKGKRPVTIGAIIISQQLCSLRLYFHLSVCFSRLPAYYPLSRVKTSVYCVTAGQAQLGQAQGQFGQLQGMGQQGMGQFGQMQNLGQGMYQQGAGQLGQLPGAGQVGQFGQGMGQVGQMQNLGQGMHQQGLGQPGKLKRRK